MTNAMFVPKLMVYDDDYGCIMRNPGREVTWPMHYHDFYEFVIYLGKAGVFRINDGEYIVERGDIVFINMFSPHMLAPNNANFYERFSINVDPGLLVSFSTKQSNLLDLFRNSHHPPVYRIPLEKFEKYVCALDMYRDVVSETGRDLLKKAIVHQLLAYGYCDCATQSSSSELDTYHVAIIAQIINYINSNLSSEISLRELAARVNYSEYYLCRLFRKQTNRTLTNYIQEKRIQYAITLMKRGTPINASAEQSGFNNYSHFYKTFKRFQSCSPLEYCANMAKDTK